MRKRIHKTNKQTNTERKTNKKKKIFLFFGYSLLWKEHFPQHNTTTWKTRKERKKEEANRKIIQFKENVVIYIQREPKQQILVHSMYLFMPFMKQHSLILKP